eukprot:jgi/Undpi1/9025/HiC_scaffold_26.g11485.m1
MDFASILPNLGLGGEFLSPVGKEIEQATSESLVNPDWALNMQICDEINSRPDGAGQAAKALKRRLKSDNPKILQLTLTLCEATVKNCSRPLHQALGTREFLTEVATLCNGQKGFEVRSQALSLVQEWGIAFQTDRSLAFAETYGRLQVQGARFPPTKDAAPVFTPAPSSHQAGGRGVGRDVVKPPPQTMEKLVADLQMVKDKITLCRQMLPESAGVDKDDALSEVVGFLEACRPRMVDLVEAGMGGALGEDIFASCLQINDALLRTLDAEREGTPIAVEDIGGDGAKGAPSLLDLDGGTEDPFVGKMSTFSIAGADDEDDFSELSNTKTPAVSGKAGMVNKPAAAPLKTPAPAKGSATGAGGDEDLDDFLNSLTDEAGPAGATGKSGGSIDDDDLENFLS